jgi:hypothetical protein
MFFLFFKIQFLALTHQNDSKTHKKKFKEKKSNFNKKQVETQYQTPPYTSY